MAALYSSAAQIVDKVIKKQGTAKSLVINNRFPKKKKLYALVCETLKCKCVNNLMIRARNHLACSLNKYSCRSQILLLGPGEFLLI